MSYPTHQEASPFGCKAVTTTLPNQPTTLERIIDVVELLENVLAFLSVQDLLLSQRVCKKWKVTIETSTRLQQCLFFEPRSLSQTVVDEGYCNQFESNSLLKAKFEPFFHNLTRPKPESQGRLSYKAMTWTKNPKLLRAYTCAEASWRKMLILQPPPPRIDVIKKVSGFRRYIEHATNIDHAESSRMGWLYDRCGDVCLGNAGGSFSLSWVNTTDKGDTESGKEPTLTLKFYHYTSCGYHEVNRLDREPRDDDEHLKSDGYSPFDIIWHDRWPDYYGLFD